MNAMEAHAIWDAEREAARDRYSPVPRDRATERTRCEDEILGYAEARLASKAE